MIANYISERKSKHYPIQSDHLIQRTRELLNTYGQPMLIDAKQKFDDGIIPEREYQILAAGAKLLDQ